MVLFEYIHKIVRKDKFFFSKKQILMPHFII